MFSPKIAIIGAGPAGCMLGRVLSPSDIPFTIYESEAGPNYYSQGGTLGLHPQTGLTAVKESELWAEFEKHLRFDSDYVLISDKNLKPMVLARSRWGYRLQRVEGDGSLVFEHVTESGFDLIVGCEGGWSKVRGYVAPAAKPGYTGIGHHRLAIPDAERTAPDLCKIVNRGQASTRSENWTQTCGYNPHNIEQVRKAILEDMYDWSPQLREAIEKAGDGVCDPKNIYALLVGLRWQHRRGATIIGDAAHLTAPFAEEGVDVALDDARRLGAAIVKAIQAGGEQDELDREVRASEEEMFARMEIYQRQTDEITALWFFSEGSMRQVMPKVILTYAKDRVPTMLVPLAWGLVPSWWAIKTRLSG
ncbi:FAD/NAD(P)-binding domain-containing protein [Durotheca rogersii]|uniref:FAD/NAD(P)-binding domain-containing protein n=1 Tax=Durotheca rogersii TaxID=419775 RepID=UPI00221E8402|nr:FAD/NAD(P)-binding domain-containing protein [Durotheca rogersii]KAI5862421.1 FAD/NAD(P)-binding domain-containing protein [Durotheca rogersii]